VQHLLFFVSMALNGMICYQIAHRRGADPRMWAMVGIFFGPIGVLFTLIWLKKRAAPQKAQPTFVISPWENDHWYCLDHDRQKHGPFTLRQLRSCARRGEITPDSFVWCTDLDEWKRIGQLEGLTEELFVQRAQPAMG